MTVARLAVTFWKAGSGGSHPRAPLMEPTPKVGSAMAVSK
jgi:hypothetical protein